MESRTSLNSFISFVKKVWDLGYGTFNTVPTNTGIIVAFFSTYYYLVLILYFLY